jgi:hypothetical protein
MSESLIPVLSTIRPNSTFLSIKGYRSAESGALADFVLRFHVDYLEAVARSLQIVRDFNPTTDVEAEARIALIQSFERTLSPKPDTGKPDAYDPVLNAEGKPIRGVKIHRATGNPHLFGLLHYKHTIEPGEHKVVNRSPLTVAKDALRERTPVGDFRQFVIKPGTYREIRVERMIIEGSDGSVRFAEG